MAVSLVACSKCGRVFDSVAEHCLHDPKTNTYTCANCLGPSAAPGARSYFSAPAAPVTRAPVRRPRSKLGSILRIGFGILVLACGIDTSDGIMIVIALLLFLWQFWPQIGRLFKKRQEEVLVQREREAVELREAGRMKICSHCGANVTGTVCEYCGMPLDVN